MTANAPESAGQPQPRPAAVPRMRRAKLLAMTLDRTGALRRHGTFRPKTPASCALGHRAAPTRVPAEEPEQPVFDRRIVAHGVGTFDRTRLLQDRPVRQRPLVTGLAKAPGRGRPSLPRARQRSPSCGRRDVGRSPGHRRGARDRRAPRNSSSARRKRAEDRVPPLHPIVVGFVGHDIERPQQERLVGPEDVVGHLARVSFLRGRGGIPVAADGAERDGEGVARGPILDEQCTLVSRGHQRSPRNPASVGRRRQRRTGVLGADADAQLGVALTAGTLAGQFLEPLLRADAVRVGRWTPAPVRAQLPGVGVVPRTRGRGPRRGAPGARGRAPARRPRCGGRGCGP